MFLLLLFSVAAASGAAGPAPGDSVVVLPGITVTATRTPDAGAPPPARVTLIDREDVSASGAENVAELLAARSTGFVRFYGSGGLATFSLRGASPGQTLLLVDGQRLSDPQTGQVDLTLLPSILLDGIEIVHGAGSALYGSDGVAGVVNLRTRSFDGSGSYALRADAGAYDERGFSGRFGRAIGRWRTGVAAELLHSKGAYPVDPDLALRSGVRRNGADRQTGSLYATARRDGRHQLAFSGWISAAERGLPGPITTPLAGERQWDSQYRLWAGDDFAVRNAQVQLRAGTQSTRIRYRNDQLEIDDTGTATGYFAEASATATRGPITLTSGLAADFYHASHPSRRNAREMHGAAFIAGAVEGWGVNLYPALRVDGFLADGGVQRLAASPKLGFSASLPVGVPTRLKASVGRTFRAPTMNERYWQPGGNPELLPERGWHSDIGIAMGAGRAVAEISGFASILEDEILWLPTPAGHYAPRNVRRTRSLGLEFSTTLSATIRPGWHVNGGAVTTLIRATDRSDSRNPSFGQPLRYVPRTQLKAFASMHVGRASFDASTRYVGRRYVTTDGTEWVDPYLVTDLQLRYRATIAGATVTASAALENAFDSAYAVIQYYPMPPRHLRFSLTIENHR